MLLETVVEVREAVGEDVPVFVRISATDWREDGWTVEDSVRLAPLLRDAGADLIDCSSGGIIGGAGIPGGPGYQAHLAAAVRGTGVLSGAVGAITSPEQADHVIRSGQADAVLLGREMLRDPYWAYHAAKALGQTVETPNQYLRAW
jgi:2,4-dienoyl-CoA reductase-like NADH-dependent reductase (Old Yellow Enzyme family)